MFLLTDPALLILFFSLGAIVASFVGVIVSRLHTGQSFFAGRSRCDACSTPLSPFSLVPIISHLVLSGRTSCCGTRLSLTPPLTELLLGGLFVLTYVHTDLSSALLFILLALSLLLALVLYDLQHQILPPFLLGSFVVVSASAAFLCTSFLAEFLFSVLTALLTALPLVLIHYVSRGRAMGFSDAPLAFGLALLVGPVALAGFIFSFWIGAVVGILILVKRPRGSRMGVEVPFAPYLAAGFLLAYFTQWNPFVLIVASR